VVNSIQGNVIASYNDRRVKAFHLSCSVSAASANDTERKGGVYGARTHRLGWTTRLMLDSLDSVALDQPLLQMTCFSF